MKRVPEPAPLSDEKKQQRFDQWLLLFNQFATTAQKTELDQIRVTDAQYVFVRDTVISELERIGIIQDALLAKIISYLDELSITRICQASSIIRDVCKKYSIRGRRFYLGAAYVNGRQVQFNEPVDKVVYSNGHFGLLITTNGALYKFDYNLIPTRVVEATEPIIDVSIGKDHALVLSKSGKAYGIGSQANGQLGNGESLSIENVTMSRVLVMEPIVNICAGIVHSIVVTASGNAYAFGLARWGTFGDAMDKVVVSLPKKFELDLKVIAAVAGVYFSVLVTDAGEVYFCGSSLIFSMELIRLSLPEPIVNASVAGSVFYLLSSTGNVYTSEELDCPRIIGRARAIGGEYFIDSNDDMLYNVYTGKQVSTLLPIHRVSKDYAYTLESDEDKFPFIGLECTLCGNQNPTTFSRDTLDLYCECIGGKREREFTDNDQRTLRRATGFGEEDVTLQPTIESILGNPNRMAAFANQLSRESLIKISRAEGNDFWGRLNRENLFWFLVAKRFIEKGFNPLVNYKDSAGRLFL